MNILLTCAGRRHYLSRYFREALAGKGWLIGTDMDLTAPALAACDRFYQVPAVSAPDYLDHIIGIIEHENVQMVFSLNDLEIGLLSDNRGMILAKTGAVVYVPDPNTLTLCADKWATFQLSSDLGLPTIPSFLSPEAALSAVQASKTSFPMIVKPRWGSASIAIETVESETDLLLAFDKCGNTVSHSPLASLGQGNNVLIQKLIVGTEYGVDVLFDTQCALQGFTAKQKLGMRSGETDKAVTVPPDRFSEPVHRISEAIRHRGNLDCDFLEQDGKIFLLEMNPRFGGGYPFSHEAGANHVERLIHEAMGKPPPKYSYERGVAFAKCDTLVRVPTAAHCL